MIVVGLLKSLKFRIMEHHTDCNACKKKEFNLHRGNLCSLTHEKPSFEGACPDFDPIPEEERPRGLADSYGPEEKVSGWLTVFLWLGLGGGSIMTLVNILPSLKMFSPLVSTLFCIMGFSAIITAIAAIYAFYRKKPNAVSLALTYIAMVAIDGVMTLVLARIIEDRSLDAIAFRSFIWSGIWLAYVLCSDKVKTLIPSETRRWGGFEKMTLVVYVASIVSIVALINSTFNGDTELSDVYDDKHIITESIAEINKVCPMDLGDGIWMMGQRLVGNEVIITSKLDNVYRDQLYDWEWEELEDETMADMLADTQWIDDDVFVKTVLDAGYDLTFEYVDYNNVNLYNLTFNKSDFDRMR